MELFPADAYQAALAARFDAVAAPLRAWVPEGRLEHIGSSSVPGAVSKGDLDLCLIVPAAAHADTVARLQAQGYEEQLDTLRTPELCMLNAPSTWPEHAVQVVAAGSEFEDFLQFRDALRADAELVQQYNAIKQAHAGSGEAAYRAAKSDFIARVLQGQAITPPG